ncbi:MAG: DUF922 domain-containing Zn-dependent protease [Candidatus Adiutrix sp.]|nr:DUF922 domain-containing Zn-dependent protease [Candidatus Adiutrix sp.]
MSLDLKCRRRELHQAPMRRPALILPVVWLALGLCFSALAEAQVSPKITYEYYSVTPQEGRSLNSRLFEETPIVHERSKFGGQTRWKIVYNSSVSQPRIGVCRLESFEVECSCHLIMPRLEGGDQSLREKFDRFYQRLDEHERRHCSIAVDYARRFQGWLRDLGEDRCERLKERVQKEYERQMEDCRAEQSRYDHRTIHGRYEGADLGRIEREEEIKTRLEGEGDGRGLANPESISPGSGIFQDADGVWRNY